MFSRKILLGTILATGTVMASALPASAAILSQVNSIAAQTTNWSNSLSYNLFNPALGTLTSIKFILDGTVEGTIELENTGTSGATITSNLQATITVTRPDTSVIVLTIPAASFVDNLAAYDGVPDFGGASGIIHSSVFSASTDTAISPPPLSDLSLFTGIGTILLPIDALATSNASGTGNYMSAFNTIAGAKLTLEYNYTPTDTNTVPEPGTLALLGTGLFAARSFRRRSKAKVSA